MSPEVYLNHHAFALGEVACTVHESGLAGRTRTEAATLAANGFERHRMAGAGTTAYQLARQAAEALGEAVAGATTLVYATALPLNANMGSEAAFGQSRDIKDLSDFPASRLQAELALEQAAVIGLTQQACTAMLGAIRLARALLVAEPTQARILCVTADRFPPGALYEQAFSLVSDGASACVVSREPVGYRVLACHAITIGALAQASEDEMAGSHFGFAHRIITETLAAATMSIRDLAWIVPQNTSPRVWQILAGALGFPLDRVVRDTVADVGHVISSDNLINLRALEATGRLRPGDRLLLFMASFGMNWQGLVLEKV
ncbi:MAG: 3-oxoacyl-[acyl-carrier-protein] synthase III C-terminal domain-containing protein [Candidatus Sericytochromatia bacterium]|nr:3-oxoacyl-[acyl-carrier-protein] synthase III C-terminal domain-containing protein [Candidatus Sericytochromatia bacterium]